MAHITAPTVERCCFPTPLPPLSASIPRDRDRIRSQLLALCLQKSV
uniref:Uncharacterized protein n=1 Tax=Arundo donax TaxID=35708 RepID=A0A0A9CE93_ARUDO